jgi:hypothetical protein
VHVPFFAVFSGIFARREIQFCPPARACAECRERAGSFVFRETGKEIAMKQTYSGGCHCGAVRFEADVDFSQGTVKCNCTICQKARFWLVAVSAGEFRLLKGEDALSEYRFGASRIQHLFCKHCGIKSFGRIDMPNGGMVAVSVTALENIPDADLAALPVVFVDGRSDNFQAPPTQTAHL